MTAGAHAWHTWADYLVTHEGKMDVYRASFVQVDELSYEVGVRAVTWSGTLFCLGGIEIEIAKSQETRHREGRLQVRTLRYKYHVQQRLPNGVVRKLWRHDNLPHHKKLRGHVTEHHRHDYREGDHEDGGRLTHVGIEGWPNLGEVLDDAHAWWKEHVAPA